MSSNQRIYRAGPAHSGNSFYRKSPPPTPGGTSRFDLASLSISESDQRRKHRDAYDGRLSLGPVPNRARRLGGGPVRDAPTVSDSPPHASAFASSVLLLMQHRGHRAEPSVPCVILLVLTARQKEGPHRAWSPPEPRFATVTPSRLAHRTAEQRASSPLRPPPPPPSRAPAYPSGMSGWWGQTS